MLGPLVFTSLAVPTLSLTPAPMTRLPTVPVTLAVQMFTQLVRFWLAA